MVPSERIDATAADHAGSRRGTAGRSRVAEKGMSMNPHGPHDQRGTAHWRADEAAMDTFTVRLPRWPVLLRLLGRDPLVRTTDRIQALVLGAGCRGVAACHPDHRRRGHRGL